jgi:hypothetical protein
LAEFRNQANRAFPYDGPLDAGQGDRAEYEKTAKSYTDHLLGEIRRIFFQQLPAAVVTRLGAAIPRLEDKYRAAQVFRRVNRRCSPAVVKAEVDERAFL